MNWNWILFGNEHSPSLRLVRLLVVLVPLSATTPWLFFLSGLLGHFPTIFADWGGLGVFLIAIAWGVIAFVVEVVLLIIYVRLKKLQKNNLENDVITKVSAGEIIDAIIILIIVIGIIGFVSAYVMFA